jgi:hypothetical protein
MLHGPTLKVVVWCFTIAGLTPAFLLALLALAFSVLTGVVSPSPPEGELVFRSNEWFQVGPVRVDDWHPRAWAALALVVGAALVVVALTFLLHVPRRP